MTSYNDYISFRSRRKQKTYLFYILFRLQSEKLFTFLDVVTPVVKAYKAYVTTFIPIMLVIQHWKYPVGQLGCILAKRGSEVLSCQVSLRHEVFTDRRLV